MPFVEGFEVADLSLIWSDVAKGLRVVRYRRVGDDAGAWRYVVETVAGRSTLDEPHWRPMHARDRLAFALLVGEFGATLVALEERSDTLANVEFDAKELEKARARVAELEKAVDAHFELSSGIDYAALAFEVVSNFFWERPAFDIRSLEPETRVGLVAAVRKAFRDVKSPHAADLEECVDAVACEMKRELRQRGGAR